MNKSVLRFLVHGLHILAILLLGFFVSKKIEQNEAQVLYKSLSQSMDFAVERSQQFRDILNLVNCQEAAAYDTESNQKYYRYNVQTLLRYEQVRRTFQDDRLTPLEKQMALSVYSDSLTQLTDSSPELTYVFDNLLRLPTNELTIKILSKSNGRQRALFRRSLYTNLALSAEAALYYQNRKLGGDSPYCGIPWIQTEMSPQITCIPASQLLDTEVFLMRSQHGIRLGLKKVWVNGARIPIENGLGKFTTTFKKPGPHDLRLRIEARGFCKDTVPRVYEKTYTINVQ